MSDANALPPFAARMNRLLDGRSASSFCAEAGLSTGGQVVRIFRDGVMPRADVLGTIARRENASLRWLIQGEGAPFRVERAEPMVTWLGVVEPFEWRAVVFDDGEHFAMAVFRPRDGDADGGESAWTELRIHSEVDPGDLRAVLKFGPAALTDVRHCLVSREELRRIASGHYGTWALLLKPGSYGQRELVPFNAARLAHAVREPASPWNANPSDAKLLAALRAMTPEERAAFDLILGPFLDRIRQRGDS